MPRAARCNWYFRDPASLTDEELYGGHGRCRLDAMAGRPYCPAHDERAYWRPAEAEQDEDPAAALAVAPAEAASLAASAAPCARQPAAAPLPAPAGPQGPAQGPTAPDRPAPPPLAAPRPGKAPARPPNGKRSGPKAAPDGRTRVDITLAMLKRPEGVTKGELAAAFVEAFGFCGPTSAAQALWKLPGLHGWPKPQVTRDRQAGRGRGAIYRLSGP